MKKVLLWLLLLPIVCAAPAGAEFYRYYDKSGRPVFVDDLGKVPPQYREKVKRYSEAKQTGQDREPPPEEKPPPDEKTETATPIRTRNGRIFVPATIGYGILETKVMLVLDTGASATTLFRHAVDRIFMRGLTHTLGRTAGGGVLPVELATLDFIRVGPHERRRLTVGIVDVEGDPPGYDGLLGMDFLRGLDFNIDFKRKVIVWR